MLSKDESEITDILFIDTVNISPTDTLSIDIVNSVLPTDTVYNYLFHTDTHFIDNIHSYFDHIPHEVYDTYYPTHNIYPDERAHYEIPVINNRIYHSSDVFSNFNSGVNCNNIICLTNKNSPYIKSLKIYYQNTRGLRTKLKDLRCNIILLDFDIFVLTETWLCDSISNKELGFDNYKIYRCDRSQYTSQHSMGGGVLLAIRKTLLPNQIKISTIDNETIYAYFKIKDQTFIINAVYLPPLTSPEKFISYTNSLDDIISKWTKPQLIICGDFNLPSMHWQKHPEKNKFTITSSNKITHINILSSCMSYMDLKQHNLIPNANNNIIDLIFTNFNSNKITVTESHDSLVNIDTHHPPLFIDLTVTLDNTKYRSQSKTTPSHVFHYKNGNFSSLNKSIKELKWDNLLDKSDINLALDIFYENINRLKACHIPQKQITDFKFPIWTTAELKDLIIKKKCAHKHMKKNPLDITLRSLFTSLRRTCKIKASNDYRAYIHKIETKLTSDPSKFWPYLKNMKNDTDLPSTFNLDSTISTDSNHIANMFAENFSSVYSQAQLPPPLFTFDNCLTSALSEIKISRLDILDEIKNLKFDSSSGPDNTPPIVIKKCAYTIVTPLLILYNWTLATGIYPDKWKTSYVIPIFKNGDRNDIKNYRPICKLSCISKLLEAIIYRKLAPILSPLIINNQHGFMTKRSTATNLISFSQFVDKTLNSGGQFDCCVTDYSKAFDVVNINYLCAKLEAYGLTGPLLTWFYNYLSSRIQIVVYKQNRNQTFFSNPYSVMSGCPQGGHLSGLLFDIFINDIHTRIDIPFWLYADDKRIGIPIRSTTDVVKLQTSMNNIYHWCKENQMTLNIKKCKIMTFHRTKKPIIHNYYFNDELVPRAYSMKDLGVTLEPDLRFITHFDNITKKGFKMLGFLNRNSKDFKNPTTYKNLYYGIVRPNLEYVSQLWSPYYDIHIKQLESVQHKFLRQLAYRQYKTIENHNYTNILNDNDILTLQHRRDVQDIIFLAKLLKNMIDAPDILEKIDIRVRGRNTRNSDILEENFCRTNIAMNSVITRMKRLTNHAIQQDPSIDIFHDSICLLKSKLIALKSIQR